MRLTVCGCAGSFAGAHAAASCYLVQAEHDGRTWSILLDLGNGGLSAVLRSLAPTQRLDGVFLSHLHADHCMDLCGLYVMQHYHPGGGLERLPVWGPSGAAERMGRAYGVDEPEDLTVAFDFADLVEGEPVRLGPFTVTPYEVWHPVTAYGLRVEAHGKVLAYSGDTDLCDALDPVLTGADVALTDCAFQTGRDDDTRGVHMTGARCAEAAVRAGGVRHLVLTHMPSWNDQDRCLAEAAGVWPGQLSVATQGMVLDL